MTSRPSIGRTRIGLLNTMFSASSSLIWAGVGLPDSRSLRKGCIVIPPMLCYLLLKSSKGLPSRPIDSASLGTKSFWQWLDRTGVSRRDTVLRKAYQGIAADDGL